MVAVTYTQLKKLMAPLKPTDKYEDVTEKLRNYYCRKKNEIVEHFAFIKINYWLLCELMKCVPLTLVSNNQRTLIILIILEKCDARGQIV